METPLSVDKRFPSHYLLVDHFVATHGVDDICLKQKHHKPQLYRLSSEGRTFYR